MTKQQIVYSACIVGIIGAGAMSVSYITLHSSLLNTTGRTIFIHYDEQIASHLQTSLHSSLQELLKQNLASDIIFENLKKDLPTLKKITIDYRIPGYLKTRITFDSPLCIIQQEQKSPLILSRSGDYAPYQHYNHDLIQGLPCVFVTESDFSLYSQKVLHQWISNLPLHFFERYQIRWNKPTDITIFDQEHQNFEYISTHALSFTPQIETQLEQLRNLSAQQKNKLKIDIRFKDQFVLIPILQRKGVS